MMAKPNLKEQGESSPIVGSTWVDFEMKIVWWLYVIFTCFEVDNSPP
jgi:hypothetical protein